MSVAAKVRNLGWVVLIALLLSPMGLTYVLLAHRIDNTARDAYIETCQSGNEVRKEVVGFVSSSVDRSRKLAQATIAAPASTAEQKRVAQTNLAQIIRFKHQIQTALAPKDCTYPPVLTGGLTGLTG